MYSWLKYNSKNKTITGHALELGRYDLVISGTNNKKRTGYASFAIIVEVDPEIEEVRIKMIVTLLVSITTLTYFTFRICQDNQEILR